MRGAVLRAGGVLRAGRAGSPYEGDSASGQTTGQGLDQFGAEWYVLGPSGKKVEKEGS